MSTNVRIFAAVGIAAYFYTLVRMIHNKKISINHAIPWLIIGSVMGIFDIFPSVFIWISCILGIQVPLNAFLIVSVLFIFLDLIYFTANVSLLNKKVLELTQANAILEKRIRELEQESGQEDGI